MKCVIGSLEDPAQLMPSEGGYFGSDFFLISSALGPLTRRLLSFSTQLNAGGTRAWVSRQRDHYLREMHSYD
jgi:hypothetical protein